MADALVEAFARSGDVQRIDLPTVSEIGIDGREAFIPLAQLLSVTCRPEAARRALLAIHYDTVYSASDPFDHVTTQSDGRWNGPGVADAKGGIAVMLSALRQFEASPASKPCRLAGAAQSDEEIGSPGSGSFLVEAAKRCDIGLLFRARFTRWMLVSERKGSGNFTVLVRGKAAHAGRDFMAGRSAVVALSKLIADVADRAGPLTINCGQISADRRSISFPIWRSAIQCSRFERGGDANRAGVARRRRRRRQSI